jgi:endo-1,4-beta-xylanase
MDAIAFVSRRRFLSGMAAVTASQILPVAACATPAPDSIGRVASAHGILAGCAVNGPGLREDAEFRRLLIDQAEIVVPENAMKWRELRPTPTTFDFTAADRLMDFAQQNEILVRGHNLCWHLALPSWFASTVTPENATHFLTDHIRHVAGRYAGRIHSWDVVNEAVNPADRRPDGLRDFPWLQLLGPGYIDLAFHTTRDTDPRALLVYNDYGIEAEDDRAAQKRDAVLRLVRSMQKRGTPIDAVGVQSHWPHGAVEFAKRVRRPEIFDMGQHLCSLAKVVDSKITGCPI